MHTAGHFFILTIILHCGHLIYIFLYILKLTPGAKHEVLAEWIWPTSHHCRTPAEENKTISCFTMFVYGPQIINLFL